LWKFIDSVLVLGSDETPKSIVRPR